ncbi:unnamed protein product [Pleuronectes platessa]|uniref:Uncharacterized protein n=1 Tax=Pleuronectes platessa TaxID=8262 RepID=A0A9N7UQH6_PLEPL|nr:unnamed protein product [Pleuronectes platessa]
MFWKNTAWSWDDAAAEDGCLLDLRKTPDSTSDNDLNHITTAATTSSRSTAGLTDLTDHSSTCSPPLRLDSFNSCSGPTNISTLFTKNLLTSSSSAQRLMVSQPPTFTRHKHLQEPDSGLDLVLDQGWNRCDL